MVEGTSQKSLRKGFPLDAFNEAQQKQLRAMLDAISQDRRDFAKHFVDLKRGLIVLQACLQARGTIDGQDLERARKALKMMEIAANMIEEAVGEQE